MNFSILSTGVCCGRGGNQDPKLKKPTSFLIQQLPQPQVLPVNIQHPFIKENVLEKRAYQLNIAESSKDRSSMVVIPTGMGKTIIAVLIMAYKMEEYKEQPGKKLLFLAPTKPLADQHLKFIKEFMVVDEERVVLFTGLVSPAEREELWRQNDIIVATPQVIQNDLISRTIDLKDVVLLITDEAHRAVGDYAYVYIARKYHEQSSHYQLLGITASPGSDEDRIVEVCKNLYTSHIEIRSEYDPDVVPYIHEIEMKWHKVKNPPSIQRTVDHLNDIYKKYLLRLKKFGLVSRTTHLSKKELLEVQRKIQARIKASRNPPRAIFMAASTQSAAIKVSHAIELLETQGVSSFREYATRLEKEAHSRSGSKGARILYNEDKFQYVMGLLDELEETHPKIPELEGIIRRQLRVKRDSKILVFSHYRDMAAYLEKKLNEFDGIQASRFVGQASRGEDRGFSQKKQIETIRQFKDREFNVLIATSVAEEGLDIPSTDLVVFYEPIPSEIRTIQRRGRTGRQAAGKVEVLITQGTRDEAYYWSSRSKEKKMKEQLNLFRNRLIQRIKEELELAEFADDLVKRGKDTATEDPGEFGEDDGFIEPERRIESPREANKEEQPLLGTPAEPGDVARSETPAERRTTLEPAKTSPKQQPLPQPAGQARLFDFDGMLGQDMEKEIPLSEVTLVVDHREFNSSVVRLLSDYGIKIQSQQLDIADYVVSSRIGIERKQVKDFLASLADGRLFTQLIQLSTAYTNPILIIEGKEDIFTERGFHPGAIFGSFASLLVDVKIPIIRTMDTGETADLIYALIKREYAPDKKIAVRTAPSGRGLRDRQRYVVEGLPSVSAVLAERLLEHFGTVRTIFEADVEGLMKVKGVGEKTAKEIRKVLDERFG